MSLERNYKLYVHIAPNGKKYYGITKQRPKQRWANGKGYHHNQHFTNAINKYGWDNIEHIVLHEGLDKEEAEELEQYMIQWYDTANRNHGYNISLGGETGNHSEESRRKLSESKKGAKNPNYGKKISEETKKKLSEALRGKNNPNYGKHHSEETRKKISKAGKGRHHSIETKQKLKEIAKRGVNSPAAKSVICTTTNTIFYTNAEAAKYYNIDNSGISKCCRGKAKSSGKLPDGTKLVWRYIDIIEL